MTSRPIAGVVCGGELVFVCVFVRDAFERQSWCTRYRHEAVEDFTHVPHQPTAVA